MLGAVADASRNLKTGTRTMPWLMDLINAHKAGSRTPSRSPENSPRDNGKGSSSSRSRAQIFADFGLPTAQEPSLDVDVEDVDVEVLGDSQEGDASQEACASLVVASKEDALKTYEGISDGGAANQATGVVREWDDFANCVRMRVYASGATERAVMTDDVPPFRMYQFPEMKQPARSELPILSRAAPVIADVMRKPAGRAGEMKRPAGAKKRPAAVLDAAENAEDDVVMIVAGDAEEEDDAQREEVAPLHCFQITSTKTSLPVRSYLQACKCSEPDAGYSSHKKQLIDQWYERDHANHLSMARKARDFIVQQKLSWEQARNVKRLMANHERAEDAD